ncbi:helix-turn-helix domain-containing protein [Mycobacterium sp.]|uniref:helix-turn-helix transcriptional regulator n=1 Tax=Mycobacterium sp. TaxID=1785 RepID=UPI0031D261C8
MSTHRPHSRPHGAQRQRVLHLIRDHDGPVDATELAARLGLHVTTTRFHLDTLCERGLVARTRIARSGVGRPRTGYVAVQGELDYRSLAEILATELGNTADKRRRRAERAGRRWAARFSGAGQVRPPAARHDDAGPDAHVDRGARHTVAVFARMGFSPQLVPAEPTATGATSRTINLRSCPVRELAHAHPEVACALHLGLFEGLLTSATRARAGAPGVRAELAPFVEPHLCVARVIAGD